MRRSFWIFTATLVLISCNPRTEEPTDTTAEAQTPERTLVFARPGDSVGLDLARHSDGESINIGINNIYETLVGFKWGTTQIEPLLALRWEISSDGLTYTFYLRKKVRFQDGTPFNADAVLFTFQRQWKKDHPNYASGAPYEYWDNMGMGKIVKAVNKINDHTVAIILNEPNAPFLANLAMAFMCIVSPTAVRKYGKNFDQNPVGTGPYNLKSWKKDDAMELIRNDNYWGKPAHIKRVVVRVIPDNQVRLLELKRGNVHIMDFPNPSDIKALQSDPNVTILSQEGMNIGYLAYNMKHPPLDQLEVRRAISMAIDRKRIVKEIFQGFGTVAKNPMPPMVLGYNPDVPDVLYNPKKARQMLRKAGIKNLKLELWAMPVARPYNPNARKMAEFIQADLKRVGIKAKIVSYDWGTYLDKIGKGQHDLVLIGWTGDNGDADNFLYTLWSREAAEQTPTHNYSYYVDDEVNNWLDRAKKISAPYRRAELYRKVLKKMAEDRPFLPIAHSKVLVPIRNEVQGYKIHPMGDRRFAGVSFKPTP